MATAGSFEESKHPRDKNGRWIRVAGEVVGGLALGVGAAGAAFVARNRSGRKVASQALSHLGDIWHGRTDMGQKPSFPQIRRSLERANMLGRERVIALDEEGRVIENKMGGAFSVTYSPEFMAGIREKRLKVARTYHNHPGSGDVGGLAAPSPADFKSAFVFDMARLGHDPDSSPARHRIISGRYAGLTRYGGGVESGKTRYVGGDKHYAQAAHRAINRESILEMVLADQAVRNTIENAVGAITASQGVPRESLIQGTKILRSWYDYGQNANTSTGLRKFFDLEKASRRGALGFLLGMFGSATTRRSGNPRKARRSLKMPDPNKQMTRRSLLGDVMRSSLAKGAEMRNDRRGFLLNFFDESKIKRDARGRFADKPGSDVAPPTIRQSSWGQGSGVPGRQLPGGPTPKLKSVLGAHYHASKDKTWGEVEEQKALRSGYAEFKFTPQKLSSMSEDEYHEFAGKVGGRIKALREPIMAKSQEKGLIGDVDPKLVRMAFNHGRMLALHDVGMAKYEFSFDAEHKASLKPLIPFMRYVRRRVVDDLRSGMKGQWRQFKDEFGYEFTDKRTDVRTGEVRRRFYPHMELVRAAAEGDLAKAVLAVCTDDMQKRFYARSQGSAYLGATAARALAGYGSNMGGYAIRAAQRVSRMPNAAAAYGARRQSMGAVPRTAPPVAPARSPLDEAKPRTPPVQRL